MNKNITEKELAVLIAIAESEYQSSGPFDEGVIDCGVWAFSITNAKLTMAGVTGKAISGVVSSLVKKGLAGTQEDRENDSAVWITRAGYDAMMRATRPPAAELENLSETIARRNAAANGRRMRFNTLAEFVAYARETVGDRFATEAEAAVLVSDRAHGWDVVKGYVANKLIVLADMSDDEADDIGMPRIPALTAADLATLARELDGLAKGANENLYVGSNGATPPEIVFVDKH